jgi:hypothetical protein
MTMEEVMAIIAKDKAMDSSKVKTTEMQKAFESALSHFADDELKDLVSQIGSEGFSLNGASYGNLQSM